MGKAGERRIVIPREGEGILHNDISREPVQGESTRGFGKENYPGRWEKSASADMTARAPSERGKTKLTDGRGKGQRGCT